MRPSGPSLRPALSQPYFQLLGERLPSLDGPKPRSLKTASLEHQHPTTLPVAEKTYLFKELYIETIIRNPKKVGLFGYR